MADRTSWRRALILACCAFTASCSESPVPSGSRIAKREAPKPKTTHDFAVPVLMYHRVTELTEQEANSPLARDLTVSPSNFEAQVRYLKENGYALLSVYDVQEALLERRELPEKAVALTFDDGYRDNFESAFPILKRHGASATIFLVQKTLGDRRHLSTDHLHQMRKEGVRYGSHSATHPDLTKLDDARLTVELAGSKAFFESILNEPVESLAYPAGEHDDRVVQQVQLAGYLTAWKKGGGPVRPGDDPFRLPRVRVHGGTTMDDFVRKVTSGVWAIRMGAAQPGQPLRKKNRIRVSS